MHRECRRSSRHAVAFGLHADFESCFVRRSQTNFQPERISIAALFALRQIPHERPKSEGERTGTRDILTIRRHFFDRHSRIRVQSSSVNRQAWFIFIGPDWPATISESYITYLHFDDKVSTALARSRHNEVIEVAREVRRPRDRVNSHIHVRPLVFCNWFN